MVVLETDRLRLRRYTEDDAAFVLELVNDAAFARYIGDKGVRSLDDARVMIRRDYLASYDRNGFGSYVVESKEARVPIGSCGLLRRDWLEDVDLGYAFLPAHRSRGYAREAARAVLAYGTKVLGLERIVAVTALDNARSIRLLQDLGFRFERLTLAADGASVRLFGFGGPERREAVGPPEVVA